MNEQTEKIIPDLQAVARCLDGIFLISDLLKNFKIPVDNQESIIELLKALHLQVKSGGHSREYYWDKIEDFLEENAEIKNKDNTITGILEDGIECSLLQPDSKGWQKGKLTMCFQFMPEKSESISAQKNSVEVHHSPLDEIRQLANSLPVE